MDKYEKEAEESRKKLQSCERFQLNTSCWTCIDFFKCEIRKDYVKRTYQAMSKDSTGGFEF